MWTTGLSRGIKTAQGAADSATQNAQNAGKQAGDAETAANDAVHRADSLDSVVKGLDNYKPMANVSVTFGFDKSVLSKDDKDQLDGFAAQLGSAKSYILEVTGGTDSIGSAEDNYELSQRRADAVAQYLATNKRAGPPVRPDRHRQGQGSGSQQHPGRPQAESPRRGAVALELRRSKRADSGHTGYGAIDFFRSQS